MIGLPTQEEAMNVAQSAPQRDSLPRERYLFAPLTESKKVMILQARPAPARSPINIFTLRRFYLATRAGNEELHRAGK